MSSPQLIEPNIKYHLFNTLEQCHQTRVELYSNIWNASIVIVFLSVTTIVLYFCFQKKTPREEKEQLFKEQSYILDKIRSFKELSTYQPITNIPVIPGR